MRRMLVSLLIAAAFAVSAPAVALAAGPIFARGSGATDVPLQLPAKPGAGDLLEAFGPVRVEHSATRRMRSRRGPVNVTCNYYSDYDAKKKSGTWSAVVCYTDTSVPKGGGLPVLEP